MVHSEDVMNKIIKRSQGKLERPTPEKVANLMSELEFEEAKAKEKEKNPKIGTSILVPNPLAEHKTSKVEILG